MASVALPSTMTGGLPTDVLEAVLEPLADTDVLLVRKDLAHLVVGVREGHRQVVHPCTAAAEGINEVGLPDNEESSFERNYACTTST